MINFPCLCGNKFSLDDSMAGGSLQCPMCSLLVSVPTLDDLKFLTADGTYDIDPLPLPEQRRTEVPMLPTDSTVEIIGRRIEEIGVNDIAPTRVAPRYDPVSGELITSHDVVPVVVSAEAKAPIRTQPVGKSRVRKIEPPRPNAWLWVLGELFMAKNMAVMGIMTIIYCVLAFTIYWVLVLHGVMFIFVPIVKVAFAAGYYSIIMQETGPGELNELPPPVRFLEWATDIRDPLIHIALASLLCFGPALLFMAFVPNGTVPNLIAAGLALLGVIFFPAAFMTLAIDGIIANLRPDRLLGVIAVAGFAYPPVILAWGGGILLLSNGVLGLVVSLAPLYNPFGVVVPRPFIGTSGTAAFFLVIAGLYSTFYACWMMGMIWRGGHEKFPWIAQRFVKEKKIGIAAPATPAPAAPSKPQRSPR